MKNLFMSLLFVLSTQTLAATIAVIDSGVDTEHQDLISNIWKNTLEIADNGRDEDGNGYQDDVWGWNFAEQNNLVIDRKYLGTFSNDPYRFFEIQGKMFFNRATEEEKKWVAEKRNDEKFRKEMGIFGNFVHGTHVAGITVNNNVSGRVLAVKLIPTEVKPLGKKLLRDFKIASKNIEATDDPNIVEDLRIKILKAGLKALAVQQMKMLEEIAAYVGNHKADIANGSFGTGYNQARAISDTLFKILLRRDPTDAESNDIARVFLNTLITEGKNMMDAAPNTLFVFASGNDGSNNDMYPTSPTNIKADNVISVGASYKYEFLAPFSNYGVENVDVIAPGMLIKSTIPGNEYLPVSGTSQAAPFVANIAAQIKDSNPALTPKEIKQILMGTVDEKSFLQGKVASAGIVNLNRAVQAAKLSLSTTVSIAINEANAQVADVDTSNSKSLNNINANAVIALPLMSMFK